MEDVQAIEWAIKGAKFPCPDGSCSNLVTLGAGPSGGLRSSGVSYSAQSAGPLQILAKGPGHPLVGDEDHLDDYLYGFTSEGSRAGDPSVLRGDRFSSRIVRDRQGTTYVLDMEQGLLRENQPVIPPGDYPYGSGMVYVGRYRNPDPDAAINDYVWSLPLQDVAFDQEGNAYIVPVVVSPDGGWDWKLYYRAAAKLQRNPNPSPGGNPTYTVVQLYHIDSGHITSSQGDGLHEIEVDVDGWVYVLKSCPNNRKDGLYVFDGLSGQPKPGTPLSLYGRAEAPTCLHVSDKTGQLYLASALNKPDARTTRLYVMDKNAPHVWKDVGIDIDGMGHMTGITEDPTTGTVWTVGFTIPKVPTEAEVNKATPETMPCFYKPCLARIEHPGGKPVVTAFRPDLTWMLPISVVWTGAGS